MNDKEREQLVRLRNQGYGYTEIARIVGVSKNTVKSFCRRNNMGGVKNKTDTPCCEYCGMPVEQKQGRKKKRFCSDQCRSKWWHAHQELTKREANYTFTCPSCRKEFTAYGNAHRKYCSHKCYIEGRFGGACDERS